MRAAQSCEPKRYHQSGFRETLLNVALLVGAEREVSEEQRFQVCLQLCNAFHKPYSLIERARLKVVKMKRDALKRTSNTALEGGSSASPSKKARIEKFSGEHTAAAQAVHGTGGILAEFTETIEKIKSLNGCEIPKHILETRNAAPAGPYEKLQPFLRFFLLDYEKAS